ncbi:hypothetical protein F7642_04255 [Tenacibaculum finnmarkense genomovar ulcerans]|uniref:antiviral reverse transcriptase Drt3a n=1 Tax=Tenacibaculum finnmarkense TaxID=2781243 RepID=UPI00187B5487|nr:antiviral reverse transcriptase Drt3a [Tenacibaculum finnmarkense]MBE7633542.1 hypothetical protein [Tenacibaculum finnmarkense genomovar ulcerans]MCD8429456.1 RNA-directed DNA polymerase [Tenacibaculum finnmarkense genomovar ulcerans]
MLDQSFSSTNFNKLFLKENRKGNFDKSHLNTEYFNKQEEFKNVLREKRELKKNKTLSSEKLDEFAERLENINNEKEEIRLSVFEEYSDKINNQDDPFQFKIEYNPVKEVYTVGKDPASYYAVKQLQQNINKTFKVIQADRNKIIKQIFNIASDGFPKIIIKTDIKSFYESIPQERLFKKIENNTLLSPFSKKLIKRLFYEFEDKKDKTKIPLKKGIPRGIGISAYLSELYMRDIDNEIKELEDVIYYARYVDDIIVIVCPKTVSKKRDYLNEIKAIVSKNLLELKDGTDGKETKTKIIDLPKKGNYSKCFNYLQYSFNLKNIESDDKKYSFQLILEISDNKIERYNNKLKKSVEDYNKNAKYNERESRKILTDRLKFLTGNFHLNNNKKNIKSGVYYSNQMLKLNTKSFKSLDALNKKRCLALNNLVPPPKIGIDKIKLKLFLLKKYCFKKGFENKEKHFYTFRFNEKEASFYSKKFKRETKKFEVIKSIWKDE